MITAAEMDRRLVNHFVFNIQAINGILPDATGSFTINWR